MLNTGKNNEPDKNGGDSGSSGPPTFPQVREVRINPNDLKQRLSQELREDKRYQLINEAKIRAMTNGTTSYEEFRQLWMAAHLRPMEKGDRVESGTSSKVVWNPAAQPSSTRTDADGDKKATEWNDAST